MPSLSSLRYPSLALVAVFCLSLAGPSAAVNPQEMFPKEGPKVPLGLVPIFWPKDNKYSPAKAELGWLLYFDKRLSADSSRSWKSASPRELKRW